jgi:uncharacterized membrane protein
MHASERDILVVTLMAVLATMSVLALASPALRTFFGLPLVLYLPGYAILRAAFRGPGAGLAKMVFAAGLSIVVAIFCGFVLHLLDGLNPEGWALALGTVTLTACGAAHARNRPASVSKRRPPPRRAPLGAGQAAMMFCAALIAIGTVALSRQWAVAHRQFAYTEFWMVPHVAGGGAFTIGVRNAERTPSSYDLELLLDDRTVAVRRSIQLGVGETWRADFSLPMEQDAAHAAEARLFRSGDNQLVYRRVWLKTAPEG